MKAIQLPEYGQRWLVEILPAMPEVRDTKGNPISGGLAPVVARTHGLDGATLTFKTAKAANAWIKKNADWGKVKEEKLPDGKVLKITLAQVQAGRDKAQAEHEAAAEGAEE